jgi:hypothetical protein
MKGKIIKGYPGPTPKNKKIFGEGMESYPYCNFLAKIR